MAWKFQHRIAFWVGLCATGALVLFAVGTFVMLRPGLLQLMDGELAEEAAEFQTAFQRQDFVETEWDHHPWLGWRIVQADGMVRAGGLRLSDSLAQDIAGRAGPLSVTENGMRWRLQAFPLGAETLVLGYNQVWADNLERRLLLTYAYSLPAIVALVVLSGIWSARRAIRPLGGLTEKVEAIGPHELDRRVPAPEAEDELRRLAVVFNAMLARLERAFAQARNFAGDASHELRTPLTIMRGELETLLRAPGLTADTRGRLVSLQEEIARLDRITEHLLQLARFDAGQGLGRRRPVDFSALVAETAEDAELLAAAREVRLETALEPGLRIEGDADHLRRLLLNLLDNATRHNHPGGYVRCALFAEAGALRLTITNSGRPIPPTERERLFERFYRAERDGAREGGHGLGLALSRQIARAHGGELRLGDAGAGEVTFELVLPRSAPVSPPAPATPPAPPAGAGSGAAPPAA
ncbi:MAG TPA: ATP-binding protein [Opitutaceae bacterium]|nr:ATP-binding protein [Opitutaceae bacterium]